MSSLRTEICVVGAGYAGLSTALHAAKRGYDVAILEATRAGAGASGRNGGQVLPGFAADPAAMIAEFGETRARELWQISLRGLDKVRALAGNACDIRDHVAVVAATKADLPRLARQAELRRNVFGDDATATLDAAAFKRALPGLAGYGALIDKRAFSIDPVKYVAALVAQAKAAGAGLHERRPATGIARDNGKWRVATTKGDVIADRVVLAANVDLPGLEAGTDRLLAPVRTFMLETAPLAKFPAWATGAAYDTSPALRYMRRTADGRLQFGAGGWPGRGNPPLAETWLRRALRKALPDLAQAKIARAWSGLVDVTTDGMPRFADREGLIHLVGFCGHGVALTTLAGQIVADAIEGEDADFRRFAGLPQTPTWPTSFGQAAQLILGRAAPV
ncbi:MAG: FAD-binding oxidoreductase [Alphaproteobacteria bacterium]|nr:FAD-binding oxidoreductase [Alphaproteobacteria bacterium]